MARTLFLVGVLVLLAGVPAWAAADDKATAQKVETEVKEPVVSTTPADPTAAAKEEVDVSATEDQSRVERVAQHWGDLRTTSDPGGTKVGQNSFNLSEYMRLNQKDRILYEEHFRDRPIPQHNATNGLREPWMQAREDGRIWHWADERMRAYDPIELQYATPNYRPERGLG